MKLDSILTEKQYGERIFIKIDVEDFEAGVFKGAVEVLRNLKPVIVCEILPREHGNQETFNILNENDYIIFGISKGGLVRFNREDFLGYRGFTDFLLLHVSIAPTLNYISYENMDIVDWQ